MMLWLECDITTIIYFWLDLHPKYWADKMLFEWQVFQLAWTFSLPNVVSATDQVKYHSVMFLLPFALDLH